MTSMIERVALAIMNSGCGDEYGAYGAARAAIEAMRDATPEMIEAGLTTTGRYGRSAMANIFSTMIDAALNETE